MSHRAWMSAAMFGMLTWSAAVAQQADKGTVSASGQAMIKAQPELVRIKIDVVGQGKDIKEALEKVTTEKEAARTKLAGLGAAADTIQVGEPTMGEGGDDARAMAIAMMRQSRRTPGAASANQAKVIVSLEATLPLKGASPEEKLVEAVELMTKAKAAFAREMTPEEKEIMEEMQGQMPEQARPGEPRFLFVHVLTDAERTRATADALAQSKASAARLAQAAGGKLGGISQISETASSASSSDEDSYPSSYYARMAASYAAAERSGPEEATSNQPGPVVFLVNVQVAYTLE